MVERERRSFERRKLEPHTAAEEKLVGTYGLYRVVSVIEAGAFLDWGFPKDLFMPSREYRDPPIEGESYVVYIFKDERTGRITASPRIDRYVSKAVVGEVKVKDAVDLLIYDKTDLGYKAIVNNSFWGLLFKNEVFKDLSYGQKVKGFIKNIRPDGKVDVSLAEPDHDELPGLCKKILERLETHRGACYLSDKTPTEDIYRLFGVSKKHFKMALGNLFRRRLIVIEEDCIRLTRPVKDNYEARKAGQKLKKRISAAYRQADAPKKDTRVVTY